MVNRKDMGVARRSLPLRYANVTEGTAIRQPQDEVGSRSLAERSPLVLQTRDIDHETVLHISFHHSLIRFTDLLNWDGLDVRGNAVFGRRSSRAFPASPEYRRSPNRRCFAAATAG